MTRFRKGLIATILVAVVLFCLVPQAAVAGGGMFGGGSPAATSSASMTESELYTRLSGQPDTVKQLVFQGETVQVSIGTTTYKVIVPDESARTELRKLAREKSVDFESKEVEVPGPGFFGVIMSLLPLILMGFLFFFLFKMLSGSTGTANKQMSFAKHKGRRFSPAEGRVFFHEVTGQHEAKQELREVVDFLKDPKRFLRLGASVPRGVLLVGPPGTGKTLLARAVAGEAGVPFFSISGSEFVEMFVGVGAARVRDLFNEAKTTGKAIIFIDEIDAVGRQRGAGMGGSSDEREQTLNQILTEMDGFEKTGLNSAEIVIIAATNRPDVLDPALLRPGRFTRQVSVDRPDYEGRLATFQLYMKSKPLAKDVELAFFARGTAGLSQADIASICNDAAILLNRRVSDAERTGEKIEETITATDIDAAISRLSFGPTKDSLSKVMTREQKLNTAVHEASHAVAYWVRSQGRSIKKITIIPTTKALGYVETLRDIDQFNMTKDEILSHIVMGLAGRVGQEKLLETTDTGAKSDNQQVWNWARAMVAEYGMSDLGILYAPHGEEHPFLGRTINDGPTVGLALSDQIDKATRGIVDTCRAEAEEIVERYREAINHLAEILLERETILGPEFEEILKAA